MRRIVITLLVVVGFYIIPSALLPKNIFYVYSILWSLSIALWTILIEKVKADLTAKKVLILSMVMVTDYLIVRQLSPQIEWVNVLAGVVMAPVMEELLFRGWVISELKGSNRDKVFHSSILFGVYHLKNAFVMSPGALIYQVFYAVLFVGPIFGWVSLKYKTLFYPMMLHSINNTIAFTATEKILAVIVGRSKKFSW